MKILYPNRKLLKADTKKAESLFGEQSGSRYESTKEQFGTKMFNVDKNATVFNHTKGMDKATNDHRTVFHNIFKLGSDQNNTLISEGDGTMNKSQKMSTLGK